MKTKTTMDVVGFRHEIVSDRSRPDGMPGKPLDISRMAALRFKAGTSRHHAAASTDSVYLKTLQT